jgi:uncharacterized protein YggE
MKKILLIVLVIAFNAVQAQGLSNEEISVVGIGRVTAFPNAAEMTLEVYHVKPTLREAVNENQSTTQQVLNVLKKYVSNPSEIKTSFITTGKATRWNAKKGTDEFIGFDSSQKIIFTLKKLEAMQDLTEDLLKTKFHKIEKINYFNTEASTYIEQAQEMAVIDAMDVTKRLAQTAHVDLGNIKNISIGNSASAQRRHFVSGGEFETFSKGMGGKGVTSSGELITYEVAVNMTTDIIGK